MAPLHFYSTAVYNMGSLNRAFDALQEAILADNSSPGDMGPLSPLSIEEAQQAYNAVIREYFRNDLDEQLDRIRPVVADMNSEAGRLVLAWVTDILHEMR